MDGDDRRSGGGGRRGAGRGGGGGELHQDQEGVLGHAGRLAAGQLGRFGQLPAGPGSSGSAVKALQHALARCHKVNLGAGGVDGIDDERTRAGVLAVRRAAGIAQDGVYGLRTQQSMYWDFQGGGQRFRGNIYGNP
ncbi:peptidoglycan-binding domain-containing protein [Streptomyces albidoflavus]